MILVMMLSPVLAFIACVGVCYLVSNRNKLIFKKELAELTWSLIGFSIPGSIIGALWVLIAYSDVEQGALAIYLLGPLGAAIGEILALGIWVKKKTKSNTIMQRTEI